MTRIHWQNGMIVAATLQDGRTYHALLLEFPWVAFYDGSDPDADTSMDEVVGRPVARILAMHKDLLKTWYPVGTTTPDQRPALPTGQFLQEADEPERIRILDVATDQIRPADFEEAQGLEAAAVWEPEHVADYLVARTRGETDIWTESLRLINPSHHRNSGEENPS